VDCEGAGQLPRGGYVLAIHCLLMEKRGQKCMEDAPYIFRGQFFFLFILTAVAFVPI
jgi:hypothetical protein